MNPLRGIVLFILSVIPGMGISEQIDLPTSWHAQFESQRNCELTTASFGVDTSDLPLGTPGFFSLRFYHSNRSVGTYWFERLGYPAGETFLSLNVMLKKEDLNTPLEKFLPLRAHVNGIELVGSHKEFPFELTAGYPHADQLMAMLRSGEDIDIRVSNSMGPAYVYEVESLDFLVASAMFYACIDAMENLRD